jgi:hypothetical protein
MQQSNKVRESVIADLTRLGVTLDDARKFLRLGATLHRLAEAQCNGDWPCDNGERKVVECGLRKPPTNGAVDLRPGCGSLWVPSSLRKSRGYLCPDCCATEDVKKLAAKYGLVAFVGGDPRGAVLSLATYDQCHGQIESGPRCTGEDRQPCTCHDPATLKSPYFTGCSQCGCKRARPGAGIESGKVRPTYVY